MKNCMLNHTDLAVCHWRYLGAISAMVIQKFRRPNHRADEDIFNKHWQMGVGDKCYFLLMFWNL